MNDSRAATTSSSVNWAAMANNKIASFAHFNSQAAS
jgi:hypothetical protein